jgi:GT2 family glycosyltransferase
VIVPAYRSQDTIGACLEALGRQDQDIEVIVVDSSPDDRSEALVRDRFPAVRYFHHPTRLLPHEARNWGAERAQGHILVFTDPDCVADVNWIKRLIAGHAQGPAVVGGAIRSMPGWWNRSVQATKFPWWLPESPAGARSEVPSGNCSLSREVWQAVQGFRGEYFGGDSEICWRVTAAGYPVWFDPGAAVTHLEHPSLKPFARERFERGRDFGRMRIRVQAWSRLRCLIYLLGSPVLPWIMLARSARYAIEGRYVRTWLATFPVQWLGTSLWCLGEACAHAETLWRR